MAANAVHHLYLGYVFLHLCTRIVDTMVFRDFKKEYPDAKLIGVRPLLNKRKDLTWDGGTGTISQLFYFNHMSYSLWTRPKGCRIWLRIRGNFGVIFTLAPSTDSHFRLKRGTGPLMFQEPIFMQISVTLPPT